MKTCSAENNADSKFCSACGGVLPPEPRQRSITTLGRTQALPRRFPTRIRPLMAGSCREPKSPAATVSCPSPAGAAWERSIAPMT